MSGASSAVAAAAAMSPEQAETFKKMTAGVDKAVSNAARMAARISKSLQKTHNWTAQNRTSAHATEGGSGRVSRTVARARAAARHFLWETQYSWSVFRFLGDYLHLFGVLALLCTLAKHQSCKGFSRSTQILYFMIFITRYLDIMGSEAVMNQNAYLIFFKVTYILSSAIVLLVFHRLETTYERGKDTCSLAFIVAPVVFATFLLAKDTSVLELFWTFSQFLEAVAMVPQYIFCYRDKNEPGKGVTLYMMSMGGYRVFYAMQWIYRKIQMPQYMDVQSWTSGVVEILFFNDYLLARFTGCSLLRAVVLGMDEKVNNVKHRVGAKVLGNRAVATSNGTELGEVRQRRRGDVKDAEAG